MYICLYRCISAIYILEAHYIFYLCFCFLCLFFCIFNNFPKDTV